LIEDLTFGSVNEALQNDRPVANACDSSGGHREVIADDIELRKFDFFREVRLVRMRYPHLPAFNRQEFDWFFFRHEL